MQSWLLTIQVWAAQVTSSDVPPSGFTYVAIGWAVSLTTGIAGMMISGKLRFDREVVAMQEQRDNEKARADRFEKKLEEAQGVVNTTTEGLLKQNATLQATIDMLRPYLPRDEKKP